MIFILAFLLVLLFFVIYTEYIPFWRLLPLDKKLQKRRIRLENHEFCNGWYRVCNVSEIKQNDVKSFDVCDRQYIVTRNKKDEWAVLYPQCPHLGGNLQKGTIDPSTGNIVCPFHGWQFGLSDGKCKLIPYDCGKCNKKDVIDDIEDTVKSHCNNDTAKNLAILKMPNWMKWENLILVWYHNDKNVAPTWYPPDELLLPHHKYLGGFCSQTVGKVEDITENAADLAHFQFLHGPFIIPFLFNNWHDYQWEPKKKQNWCAEGKISNNVAVFGKTFLSFTAPFMNIGPAIIRTTPHVQKVGNLIIIDTSTPREKFFVEREIRIYGSKYLPRFLFYILTPIFAFAALQDNVIFNYRTPIEHPIYTICETPLIQFRRWFKQFYPTNKRE